MDPDPIIIVGLGNPGEEYESTRHNIGFMAVDLLAQKNSIKIKEKAESFLWGRGRIDLGDGARRDVVLVKPTTYMNLSGQAVRSVASKFKAETSSVIITCDDCALSLGELRIRKKGGSGGQKGLASIIKVLGTEEFARLRLGVGRPAHEGADLSSYVLGRFRKEELDTLSSVLDRAASALTAFTDKGIDFAMNNFN